MKLAEVACFVYRGRLRCACHEEEEGSYTWESTRAWILFVFRDSLCKRKSAAARGERPVFTITGILSYYSGGMFYACHTMHFCYH